MNNRLLTVVAMLPATVAGMFMMGNKADGQLATTINPLSVIQGPVEADVFRVIDGDTVLFVAYPWAEMTVRGTLRIDGIDSPEKSGKCPDERKKALEATAFLKNTIEASKGRVKLSVIGLVGEDGGSFGRYRAQVTVNNKSVAELMIEKGHARENHGEKRQGWCNAS